MPLVSVTPSVPVELFVAPEAFLIPAGAFALLAFPVVVVVRAPQPLQKAVRASKTRRAKIDRIKCPPASRKVR